MMISHAQYRNAIEDRAESVLQFIRETRPDVIEANLQALNEREQLEKSRLIKALGLQAMDARPVGENESAIVAELHRLVLELSDSYLVELLKAGFRIGPDGEFIGSIGAVSGKSICQQPWAKSWSAYCK